MKYDLFRGVVEDINDPLRINRVRVRIFDLHPELKIINHDILDGLGTEDLYWSAVMMPCTSAGTSGIGQSPHGLVNGSWVIGLYNPNVPDDAFITGVILGQPAAPANPQMGFNDPDGVYPNKVGEPDVNRLAVNNPDKPHDILKQKSDQRTTEIPLPQEDVTFDQPESPYDAIYPFNKVEESTSGHVKEMDNTPTKERLHNFHRTGTFTEIHPDGSKVNKIVTDSYEIIDQNGFIHIAGIANVSVGGSVNVFIGNNNTVSITQNNNVLIGGNNDMRIQGNDTVVIEGNQDISVTGSHELSSDSSTETIEGRKRVTCETLQTSSTDSTTITATEEITVLGKVIRLN